MPQLLNVNLISIKIILLLNLKNYCVSLVGDH